MVIMCTSKLISPISGYYEILGRSNEKFHWGLEHESAKAGDCDNNVSASPLPLSVKSSNEFDYSY